MATAEELPLRIHVLRRFNPAIACLLKSPLHRLASQRLLLLTYPGRKSGKLYTIPLVYVTLAGRSYCVTRTTLWWKSAVDADSITIWLRGVRSTVRAERVDSAAADTRAVFVKFLKENPGTASLLYNVRMNAQGEPDESDVAREIHESKIIELTALSA